MTGIKWSGRNIEQLPVICKIVVKAMRFNKSTFPSEIYEIVEITDDGEIYITNKWYKEGVPQIIHKSLIEEIIKIKKKSNYGSKI